MKNVLRVITFLIITAIHVPEPLMDANIALIKQINFHNNYNKTVVIIIMLFNKLNAYNVPLIIICNRENVFK